MGTAVLVRIALIASLATRVAVVHAYDMDKLDEALPKNYNISRIFPVFDFDSDGCLPSSAIGRKGQVNEGLPASGGNKNCRSDHFLDSSNTYHRYACMTDGSTEYCGHSFALYMLKDKISGFASWIMGGHRHDWEQVVIWTEDGVLSHASYTGRTFQTITTQDGHPQLVYHQEGLGHHKFRRSKTDEAAENPYDKFVTPTVVSWFTMEGDGVSNEQMRKLLAEADFGSMTPFPHSDDAFIHKLYSLKPDSFPEFTKASIRESQ